MDRNVPSNYKRLQKNLKFPAGGWKYTHWLFGFFATVGALLIEKYPTFTVLQIDFETNFLVAIGAAFLTFFEPGRRAANYQAARTILHKARDKFIIDINVTPDTLAEAMDQARDAAAGKYNVGS